MLLFRLPFFSVVSVAQLAELWIVAPAVGGSNPLAHPMLLQKKGTASSADNSVDLVIPCAPVAQLDRASDFESAGRPFESGRVRHSNWCQATLVLFKTY
jgi:hypothetical protein